MSSDRDGHDEQDTLRAYRRANLIIGGLLFSIFASLQLVLWAAERGGVLSIVSALFAVHGRQNHIDIDKNGLRFPAEIIIWFVLVVVLRIGNIRVKLSRRTALLFAVVVFGGGIIFDALVGRRAISAFMASHGYSRCASHDYENGNGKSSVWFASYALGEGCRSAPDNAR
jgi:hypothetical protein